MTAPRLRFHLKAEMVTREIIAQSLKGLASKDEDLNLIPRLHDLNKTKQNKTRKKERKDMSMAVHWGGGSRHIHGAC